MNILITGGAGYIGSNVALLLLDKGYKVTIVDNLLTGSKEIIPLKANFLNSDISDKQKISELFKKNKFDVVMHFAGLVKVEESFKFPEKYNLYNVEKTKIFIDCCIESGLNKIIFSSSAGVYGKSKDGRVAEKDLLKPLNPYAKSKLEVEQFLLNLSKNNKIKTIILRYFNVAGADKEKRSGMITKKSNNLIKAVCEFALKKRDNFIVNGNDYDTKDGTPIRDFIHVTDLADIHLIAANYLLKELKTDIFNCGYSQGFSVLDVINEIEKITGKKLDYKLGPRRNGDIPISIADTKKFKEKFNWQPKHNSLNYILETALNWEKKY